MEEIPGAAAAVVDVLRISIVKFSESKRDEKKKSSTKKKPKSFTNPRSRYCVCFRALLYYTDHREKEWKIKKWKKCSARIFSNIVKVYGVPLIRLKIYVQQQPCKKVGEGMLVVKYDFKTKFKIVMLF